MKGLLRRLVALGVGGLIAAALLGVGVGGAANNGGQTPGGMTVSGYVTDQGAPAGSALVVLRAWPSQATQLATAPGAPSPLYTVTVGRTNGHGSYSLAADLSTVPAAYRSDDGTVNLVVMAMRHGRLISSSFPASIRSGSAQAMPTLDLASGGYSQEALAADTVTLASTGAQAGAASTRNAVPYLPCGGGSWSSPYGPYQVKIGDATADQIANPTFTYAHGSSTSTTLGIAVNSGSSWSASGTSSSAAGTSAGFTATAIQTDRMFAQWRYHTYYGCGAQWAYPYDYVARGNTVSIAHPTYSYCGGLYRAGDIYRANSYSNGTYSDGLSVYGVSLSSQAGWNTSMTLTFNFTGNGYVCGNTSAREAAPRVEADNNN